LDIILDFKEAERSSLLDLSNKIKKLLNTFGVLKVKIILKDYDLFYQISKQADSNNYFNCMIEMFDKESKSTNFVKYFNLLEEEGYLFEKIFADPQDFGYTGIKCFYNTNIDDLITESTDFLFIVFKVVKNIIFI
jgi:hypothetical protein